MGQKVRTKLRASTGEEGNLKALNSADSVCGPAIVSGGKSETEGGQPLESNSNKESVWVPEEAIKCPALTILLSKKIKINCINIFSILTVKNRGTLHL